MTQDATIRARLATRASSKWEHPRADERWKHLARCRGEDPGLWFPKRDGQRHYDRTVRARNELAKAICQVCPVARECLAYAVALDLRYGTWGGLTETERARLTGKRPEA